MLHSFYRDEFLRLGDSEQQQQQLAAASPEELRRRLLARQAACSDGRQCVDQLADAFDTAAKTNCRGCCLDGPDRGHSLAQFATWRAAQLKKSALAELSVRRCWLPVLTVPVDWELVRQRRACVCPFLVPSSGGLVWRPACPEAVYLLFAQACGIGVDLQLRLQPALVTPCHSFLMGDFVRLYKTGQWPPKERLARDGPRLTLDLNADRCPPEVVQFAFYSAYGHVICLRDNRRLPTAEGLAALYTVTHHVISEVDSDFRRLADVDGLMANIIVLLKRSTSRLQPSTDWQLLDDLDVIFRLSPKLFGDSRAVLIERVRDEVTRQLTTLDESPIQRLHWHGASLRQPDHRGQDLRNRHRCVLVEVCAALFQEMILREKQGPTPESSLKRYLAGLVDLHETDRCAATLQACRDLRLSAGLLSLITIHPESPAACPSLKQHRLSRMLSHLVQTLLQLTCDQAVLNMSEAAGSLGRSQQQQQSGSGAVESILAVDYRFVTAFTDAAMSALARCHSDDPDDEGEEESLLSDETIRSIRNDLNKPEILSMLKYQEAAEDFKASLRDFISGAKSKELAEIAFNSRRPRLRLLTQAVAALLLGDQQRLSLDFNNNDQASVDSWLCAEGRKLLTGVGDAGLVNRLRRIDSSDALVGQLTLLARPRMLRPLMRLLKDSAGESEEDDELLRKPQTSGRLLLDWLRSAARCLSLLRKTSQRFSSIEDIQRGLLRAGGCFQADEAVCRAELIERLAEELLAGDEMEPESFSALSRLLTETDGQIGDVEEEEKLDADAVDFDEQAASKPAKEAAAGAVRAAFLMRLLAS